MLSPEPAGSVARLRAELADAPDPTPVTARQQRAAAMISAIRAVAPPRTLADLLAAHHVGWDLEQMFPYALVDWALPPDPERARMVAEVAERAPGAGDVLVLGCGAAGLVHDLGAVGPAVYGVDLSLVTLLFARRLLDGESTPAPVEGTAEPVVLRGADPPDQRAHLLVADAAALPFSDASMSAVLTPYLLDIVPEAGTVLREVNRVLAPGGLWLQHGLPFRVADDPPGTGRHTTQGWPAFVDRFGFASISAERLERLHLDLRAVNPWCAPVLQPVVHALSRKVRAAPRPAAASAVAACFAGDPGPIRRLRPALTGPVEASTPVGAASADATRRIRVGRCDYRLPGPRAAELLALLGAIDGDRDVGAIVEVIGVPERDVVSALDVLRRMALVVLR